MTAIEWTHRPGTRGETWNPVVGCSIVSPGCTNCYAMKMAGRLEAMAKDNFSHYAGTTQASKAGAVWTGKVSLSPEGILTKPLRWTKPRTVFVNSMGDLFHESVPDEWIDRVFAVMALSPQHTFQILTKRSWRMRDYVGKRSGDWDVVLPDVAVEVAGSPCAAHVEDVSWPFPNVWLGVSAEDQTRADERIPDLLATPAAVRFVSAEPLLGPIDFTRIDNDGDIVNALSAKPGMIPHFSPRPRTKLDWIIAGGESGPGARPMHPDWVRSIRDQCEEFGTPFFFKQWGEWAATYDRDKDDPDWRKCDAVAQATPNGQWLNFAGGQGFHGERVVRVDKFGKSRTGRLLDGREHLEFPSAASPAKLEVA